jgi:putative selenate reductase molybdopterin-binding subunit
MPRRGAVVNPSLRNYRIPAFADTSRDEVTFADTYDSIGPLGTKSQGECFETGTLCSC